MLRYRQIHTINLVRVHDLVTEEWDRELFNISAILTKSQNFLSQKFYSRPWIGSWYFQGFMPRYRQIHTINLVRVHDLVTEEWDRELFNICAILTVSKFATSKILKWSRVKGLIMPRYRQIWWEYMAELPRHLSEKFSVGFESIT